jgi:hypothetical protein
MSDDRLLHLAQQLEWLGCDAGYFGKKQLGPEAEVLMEKQRAVISTAEKIERELRSAIRFNLSTLVGIDYPIEWSFESIGDMLSSVDDIKRSALDSVQELPPKVRRFTHQVQEYMGASLPLNA